MLDVAFAVQSIMKASDCCVIEPVGESPVPRMKTFVSLGEHAILGGAVYPFFVKFKIS